jgi:capsular exopolysaccharide synthesis family protein
MSRIDEALKRASHSPIASRSSYRGAEAPLRLAEETTLNEYPLERSSPPLAGRADAATEHAVVAPRRGEPRRPVAPVHLPSSEKLVTGPTTDSISKEQFRRLAATLHDAQVSKGLKTVMVTSSVPKEGKTLTVVNLALTLSESYRRRVLIVDADLRRPSIHEVLGISNDRGLTDMLRSDRMESPIVDVSPNLSVLPSGRHELDPMASLSSDRMKLLLEGFAAKYDWVLIDTPPIGLLSDAQLLVRLAQAVLFVIRAGSTPFPVVDRAINELGRDCIIGTVLNAVDGRALPTTGYYGEYYGHYSDRPKPS